MKESNTIQNLGLDVIPIYQYGGPFGPLKMIWDAIFNKEKIEQERKQKEKDTKNVNSKSKKSKTKVVRETRTASTTNGPQQTTSTVSTPSAGNMDWMASDYGNPSTTTETITEEIEKRDPFSANDFVWGEDSPLSKIDTGVTSRYLKSNLQDLVNLYNLKIAETLGQKRV